MRLTNKVLLLKLTVLCAVFLTACGGASKRTGADNPNLPVAQQSAEEAGTEMEKAAARIDAAIRPSEETAAMTQDTGGLTDLPLLDDADNDGVADAEDQCPDTANGQIVRDSGCSLFFGAIENVDFPANAYLLTSESRESLAELVQGLEDHPGVVISLGGHTDNRGKAVDNLELSKQRVIAVVRYLVANGIDPERLKPYGYGESRPIMSNATGEGRAKNRRIELSVVGLISGFIRPSLAVPRAHRQNVGMQIKRC